MASWSNQLMMERNFKKTNQHTSLPAYKHNTPSDSQAIL